MQLTPERDEEVNFWPVYSDLAMVMILILLLFIVTQFIVNSQILAQETLRQVTGIELDRARQQLQQRQARIKELFSNEPDIRSIRQDGSLQTFIFSADVLFPTDQAVLSSRGYELLRRFGSVLKDNAAHYTRIEVEGHADLNQSKNFFRPNDVEMDHGNWRLSAERAITVAQIFQSLGIDGQKLAVVGRSLYEPEIPVRFEDRLRQSEALSQNRRVQVRLFYSEVTP